MIVCELVDRYLKTKTGVRQSTKQGYVTVQRLLAKEAFGKKTIRSVKTSDAKLFLIKLQQEDEMCIRDRCLEMVLVMYLKFANMVEFK